jgi:hypothetical protein
VDRYLAALLDPRRGLLRSLGGLLFATGALVLFFRKSPDERWAEFALLLVLLVPCVALYALGLGLVRREDAARPGDHGPAAHPWQPVLLVFAILLVPLVLFQFLDLIGGSTEDSLNSAWIFAVTAALAVFAVLRAGVSYGALLATLALLIAWLSLWDKILDDPSGTTFRWLLVIVALIFLAVAVVLHAGRARQAAEVVTGAGVAAVAAGVVGVVGIAAAFAANVFSEALGASAGLTGVQQHLEWDLFLLVVSLALIAYGSRAGVRGPSYVGTFGLLAFIVSAGVEISRVGADKDPEGNLFGWPLVLLLVGAAALIVAFVLPDRLGPGRPASREPGPGAPGPPGPAR